MRDYLEQRRLEADEQRTLAHRQAAHLRAGRFAVVLRRRFAGGVVAGFVARPD